MFYPLVDAQSCCIMLKCKYMVHTNIRYSKINHLLHRPLMSGSDPQLNRYLNHAVSYYLVFTLITL